MATHNPCLVHLTICLVAVSSLHTTGFVPGMQCACTSPTLSYRKHSISLALTTTRRGVHCTLVISRGDTHKVQIHAALPSTCSSYNTHSWPCILLTAGLSVVPSPLPHIQGSAEQVGETDTFSVDHPHVWCGPLSTEALYVLQAPLQT